MLYVYTDAENFRGTNCLKYPSKIRMIKLENVHKFCRKNMWVECTLASSKPPFCFHAFSKQQVN